MDEIERRIRAARPVSGNRTLPLTDRAKRELADLLIAESHVTQEKKPRWLHRSRLLGLAGLVLLAVAVGVFWPHSGQHAHAIGPPALVIEPINSAPEKALTDLAAAAAQSIPTPPSDQEVVITMQSWYLHMTVLDEDVDPSLTVVSPEKSVTRIAPDGSFSRVVTAGIPHDESGNFATSEIAPGTVLSTVDRGPDEYIPTFSGPAPREAAKVGAFLTEGAGFDVTESANNAFHAVAYLLAEQRLDGAQTSALIAFLGTLPDYKVAGTAQDRLDRPALVLTAVRPGDQYTDYLLLDQESGEVLAIESVYTGDSRTDMHAPTVMSYEAWVND